MRQFVQKLTALKTSYSVVEGKQFLGTVLLSIVAVCVIFGELLVGSYNATEELAVQTSASIGELVDHEIAHNFELLNSTLHSVTEGFNDPGLMALEPSLRQRALFNRVPGPEGLASILILNEDGNAVLDSRSTHLPDINFADRDYFQVHKSSASIGPYLSRPLQSRLRDGEWLVIISHRLSHEDGSFAGVAIAGLQLNYFQHIFQKAASQKNSSITLVNENGFMLARYPNIASFVGQKTTEQSRLLDHYQKAQQGTFERISFDGIKRIYSYRKISGLPLILCVGLSNNEVFGDWWYRVLVISLSILVLFALIIILTLRIERELRRRKQVERQLESLASTDPLTGIANRRKFDEALQSEWARARRSGLLFSMLMVDVDLFKSYNDRFGHQEGDKALKAIANCLQATIRRPADLIARYGGEEFAVLLPNTDENGARYVAELMRDSVQRMVHPCLKDSGQKLTVSIGIGSLYPAEEDDMAKLLREADRALYIAKASGRNCVQSSRTQNTLTLVQGTPAEPQMDLIEPAIIDFKKDSFRAG